MNDIESIIRQLESQKASIDRAISALRDVAPQANTMQLTKSLASAKPANGSPARRVMTKDQKKAISESWTPERKQKFAEFHVKRLAMARGEDPAKALREYRKRKKQDQ